MEREMGAMVGGSCLCGVVRWRVDSFEHMTHCHCSMCRKAHGAPFATYAAARGDGFAWLAGEDAVRRYESSPGFRRAFCGHCGSVVPAADGDRQVFVPAGCLDDDPGIRPSAHIFFPSRAPWHVVADELPRHDAYPEPEDGPVIDRPGPGTPEPGVLRGSCLCGAVAYEVREPFRAVYNCHCSRCRKARAAAHTTNGFTSFGGVRLVRGADALVTYRLPAARFFAQTFCGACGSGVPRLDPERGIAAIPLGSLDDDPGRGADCHIYVGSKAGWYEITDDLPQFAERPG